MDTVVDKYCTVAESLKESLQQVKMIRAGKLKAITWNEAKKEINKEK